MKRFLINLNIATQDNGTYDIAQIIEAAHKDEATIKARDIANEFNEKDFFVRKIDVDEIPTDAGS